VLGEAWKKNLDDLVKDGIASDLVCFTGDVAQSGRADEYELATMFVKEVLQRLDVPEERLFMVPGNHDINRDVNKIHWEDLRPALLAMPAKARSDWLAGGTPPHRYTEQDLVDVLARQEGSRSWLRAPRGRNERPELLCDPPLDHGDEAIRGARGRSTGLVCLDTRRRFVDPLQSRARSGSWGRGE
jgi:hypothetical protein